MAKYTLTKENIQKVAIGTGIAGVGAMLTYLTSVIPDVDFGNWTPVVVAGFSVLVNVIRQFLRE